MPLLDHEQGDVLARKLADQRLHSPGNRPITSICVSAWTAPGNAGAALMHASQT